MELKKYFQIAATIFALPSFLSLIVAAVRDDGVENLASEVGLNFSTDPGGALS